MWYQHHTERLVVWTVAFPRKKIPPNPISSSFIIGTPRFSFSNCFLGFLRNRTKSNCEQYIHLEERKTMMKAINEEIDLNKSFDKVKLQEFGNSQREPWERGRACSRTPSSSSGQLRSKTRVWPVWRSPCPAWKLPLLADQDCRGKQWAGVRIPSPIKPSFLLFPFCCTVKIAYHWFGYTV